MRDQVPNSHCLGMDPAHGKDCCIGDQGTHLGGVSLDLFLQETQLVVGFDLVTCLLVILNGDAVLLHSQKEVGPT